ncbi:histidinol-phosphate aminotransferase [Ramicandelaber brevisporus]|nr:histidinol-phosphate aminotransferase [Ramicandelaber brevisporus]
MVQPKFDVDSLVRPNIKTLKPYRCARDDYSEGVLLDANENAFGPAFVLDDEVEYHRYPDPRHNTLKQRIVEIRGVPSVDHIFLGVGSDEVIDILTRVFCVPGKDKVLVTPPTYGMYSVTAAINDVSLVKVPLIVGDDASPSLFQLDVPAILKTLGEADGEIKLVYLCSPGNPTGTLLTRESITAILEAPESQRSIIVVDEAYIDFAEPWNSPNVTEMSSAPLVAQYPNLVVSQTLSKSYGLAGIRLGIAMANPSIITYLNNTKAPYNVSTTTANIAHKALSASGHQAMIASVKQIRAERDSIIQALTDIANQYGTCRIVGANDGNFVMFRVLNKATGQADSKLAKVICTELAVTHKVVVRYRGDDYGCEGCIRVTIGTAEENAKLIGLFQLMLPQNK